MNQHYLAKSTHVPNEGNGVLDDNLNVASSSTSVSSSTCGSSHLQKGQHYADVVITSTMDIVKFSTTPCCGLNYILHMVDPVSGFGQSLVVKTMLRDNVITAGSSIKMKTSVLLLIFPVSFQLYSLCSGIIGN
jgi:hypothetical protein